jgi:hypothetical protein
MCERLSRNNSITYAITPCTGPARSLAILGRECRQTGDLQRALAHWREMEEIPE